MSPVDWIEVAVVCVLFSLIWLGWGMFSGIKAKDD